MLVRYPAPQGHITGALDTAFKAVSKGTAFQFKQAMAGLATAGIQLGAIFAPVDTLDQCQHRDPRAAGVTVGQHRLLGERLALAVSD